MLDLDVTPAIFHFCRFWGRRLKPPLFLNLSLVSTCCKPGGCQWPLGGKDINTEPAGVHIRAALPVAEDSLRHFVTSTNTLSNQLLIIIWKCSCSTYVTSTIPSDKNPHLPDKILLLILSGFH